MLARLGHRDRLLPFVQLLVHLHGLLDEALLQQQLLGARQMALEHGQLGLDGEVAEARARDPALRLDGARHVVHLPQVARLGHVADGAEAALGCDNVLTLERERRELLPHGLRLGRQLEPLEHVARALQVALVHRGGEGDERFIELVRDGVHPLVDDHLGPPRRALNVLNVALDRHDRLPLGRVDVVPNAEVGPVLRHHNVRVGHPLHVGAEGEQRRARLRRDVVEVERAPLVAEEKFGRAAVHLHPVDLGFVRDGGVGHARRQLDDAHRLQVKKVGHLLGLHVGPLGVAALVEAHRDKMRRRVLGAARAKHLVFAVLYQRQLTRVEDHAHLLVLEEELLVA
mmetsp:Transcript_28675/g.62786  ORF Transcript_28675/g.62786 Transcript_28675/m.62786 type:complete len:342 (+) Transcript_28675:3395-4420(+)